MYQISHQIFSKKSDFFSFSLLFGRFRLQNHPFYFISYSHYNYYSHYYLFFIAHSAPAMYALMMSLCAHGMSLLSTQHMEQSSMHCRTPICNANRRASCRSSSSILSFNSSIFQSLNSTIATIVTIATIPTIATTPNRKKKRALASAKTLFGLPTKKSVAD